MILFCFFINFSATAGDLSSRSASANLHYTPAVFCSYDTLPKTNKDTAVIPFEYKQSALYQPFTFVVIDSVINILLTNDSVTLTINGYAHRDEGTDSICYYLSLNRALVIRDYVLGRGVDSARIFSLKGWGNFRSKNRKTNNEILRYNCRAEIMLNYPIPPPPPLFLDKDEDGIADSEDKCPEEYGELINSGCPDKNAIIVPFDVQQSSLNTITYKVLDSVINILLNEPAASIIINGHAYKKEGNKSVCEQLANERANIVKNYLLTRRITASRINSVKGLGNLHPITAGRNPAEIARNSRAEIFMVRH
jgi:outer membrane protein OmpA-like peptidoglycan-associated protein